MSPQSPPSQAGRLARGPFVLAVAAVYAASFVSQMLLAPPVNVRFGIWPFVLAQAGLIWLWVELHVRRLRDAGRPVGIAIGIALIYALEVVLLVLLIWMLGPAASSGGAGSDAGILRLFIILYLLGTMSGDPGLGALQAWLIGFAAIMILPVAIAVGFSLRTALRPSVQTAP